MFITTGVLVLVVDLHPWLQGLTFQEGLPSHFVEVFQKESFLNCVQDCTARRPDLQTADGSLC